MKYSVKLILLFIISSIHCKSNSLIDHDSLIIDKLKVGESFKLVMVSTGCEHGYVDSCIISRTQEGYIIFMRDWNCILTNEEIQFLRNFEKCIYDCISDEKGCTTTDIYRINYLDTKGLFIDSNGKWRGYDLFFSYFVGGYPMQYHYQLE